MSKVHQRPAGLLAVGLAIAFLAAPALAPMAAAESQLNVKSVGEIFVDAAGKASGQNVAASIVESSGVLESYKALALGTEVFGSVKIDGFAQVEKLQGVGSSSLMLRGSNAVVSVYDNINSEFRIQATEPVSVHYSLAPGVRAEHTDRRVLAVYEGGAYLGSLVLVGANGQAGYADTLAFSGSNVEGRLSAGSQLVWTAQPVYTSDRAYHAAFVDALAKGHLSSKWVTEFEGSAQAASKVDYFASSISSDFRTTADRAVETDVKSRSQASTILAYDLAYESLPARSANDVAVYVDGQLAARATTPAEVAYYAEAGLASFFATVENGRAQVLASTPDFRSASQHRVAIVADASASSESQARADSRASAESRGTGAYALHANGKLTGLFTTSTLEGRLASVRDFTTLSSRTEVFTAIRFDEGAELRSTNVGRNAVTLEGPRADATLVDDAYATIVIEAREATSAAFDLGAGMKATSEAPNVIRLEGPHGFYGTLVKVAASAEAAAAVGGGAAPQPEPQPEPVPLTVPRDDRVVAPLEPGSRLVFRSQTDARAQASERAVTQAIAAGQIGGQVLAGLDASAVRANSVSYSKNVDLDVVTASRGGFTFDYTPRADAAKTFVFDSRGLALAARHASDVRVLVNGAPATAVMTPQAAIDAGATARYHVDTSLDGITRVIVNTATPAAQRATVSIESAVDAGARAKANTDSFGLFKLFYDGSAVGSFVSLKTDQQAGVVNDFTMISTGQTVFKSVQAGASPFVSAGSEGASSIVLENREAKLEFTDTTSAYMRVVAQKAATANFALAPDIRAEQRSQSVVELTGASGNYLGSMIITDVEGRAAQGAYFEQTASDQVRATLDEGSQVIFRTHVGIEAELSQAQRTMINHAIAAGRVAGQVLVQSQASLSAVQHASQARARLESSSSTAFDTPAASVAAAEALGRVTTAITASYYNDVQMVTAATQQRVDVTVSSATSVGKTIIVSLDPATIPTMATGDAEILVDGKLATQASSYADILNPNDDNGAFEYFVLAGEAGTQVLVSMPHFSTHTVTLKAREASAPPVFMYATIFLGVLVVVETALLVRRRNA